MMVPQTSATYAGSNEKPYDQIPINANHSDIVKFSDQSDPEFAIIQDRINKLIATGPEVIKERFAGQRASE